MAVSRASDKSLSVTGLRRNLSAPLDLKAKRLSSPERPTINPVKPASLIFLVAKGPEMGRGGGMKGGRKENEEREGE